MPGSQEWRHCAASQISQQLPDDTADTLAVLDRRAVDRHIWPKAEYERAVELINRGYDKLMVAQIIGRTPQRAKQQAPLRANGRKQAATTPRADQ